MLDTRRSALMYTASEIAELYEYMSSAERIEFDRLLMSAELPPWTPNPPRKGESLSPQQAALDCKADILLYGGAAGGGKTDLLIGGAILQHTRSIIFRREFAQLKGIRDRAEEIYGPYGKFNGQDELWRLSKGKYAGKRIEFGACQLEGSENKYQGRAHDLKAFDEIPHFSEAQFRFLIAWNRSTNKGQRCRVIAAGNPPTDAQGLWVIKYWAAWLDPRHPNPAKPGELRWYITIEGEDIEVPSGDPVWIDDKSEDPDPLTGKYPQELVKPLSRSFIPARVEDNPHYMATGYKAILQALPEPLRSRMLKGSFGVGEADNEWQVFPTAWVLAAQQRWEPTYEAYAQRQTLEILRRREDLLAVAPTTGSTLTPEPAASLTSEPRDREVSMPQIGGSSGANLRTILGEGDPILPYVETQITSSGSSLDEDLGVDVSRGGKDPSVYQHRKGKWFAQPVCVPGKQTPDGLAVVQTIIDLKFGHLRCKVDVTGVGSSPVDIGRLHRLNVVAMSGAESSLARDRSSKLGFANARSEWIWKLREDLDPAHGSTMALPPDPELLAELTTLLWSLTRRGIQVESKQDVKKRIGRSTNKADAIVYANAQPYMPGEGLLEFMRQEIIDRAERAGGGSGSHGYGRNNRSEREEILQETLDARREVAL